MGNIYPAEIAWQRRKSNLSGRLRAAARDQCLPVIEDTLEIAGDPIWQLFDQQGIRELLNKAKGKTGAFSTRFGWFGLRLDPCHCVYYDSSSRPSPRHFCKPDTVAH